ncbi:MAG: sigma-70 family RNA polymerase sigma factor [Alphaproteobacteria bacterium]|nr:sigma-70 family RNA polymerase sigma factor [Alphaproteobacteria bacterium SS10]
MAAIARGDRNAFGVLVARHLGRAMVIARGFDGLEADAEDVVQEAFTKVWTSAADWQPPAEGSVEDRKQAGRARFTTWFHRVLVNRCIDRQRQVKRGGRGRHAALDSIAEPADDRPSVTDRLEADDRDRLVRDAIATLPERQRIALTLCAFEGHSNAEAGEIMGLGVKAVEALLVRARRQLREVLDPNLLTMAG